MSSLRRIITLLLVPCLTVDPALAEAHVAPPSRGVFAPDIRFPAEAFSLPVQMVGDYLGRFDNRDGWIKQLLGASWQKMKALDGASDRWLDRLPAPHWLAPLLSGGLLAMVESSPTPVTRMLYLDLFLPIVQILVDHLTSSPESPTAPAERRRRTGLQSGDSPMTFGMDFGLANLAVQIGRLFKALRVGKRQKADPVPVRTEMQMRGTTGGLTWKLIFPALLKRRVAWLSGGNARSILLSEGALFCNYIVVWDTLQKRAVLIHTMVQKNRQAKVVLREAMEYLGIDPANQTYIQSHLRSIIARPNTFDIYLTLMSWLVARAFAIEIDALGILRLRTDWNWRWYLGRVGFRVGEGIFYTTDGSRTLDLKNHPPAAPPKEDVLGQADKQEIPPEARAFYAQGDAPAAPKASAVRKQANQSLHKKPVGAGIRLSDGTWVWVGLPRYDGKIPVRWGADLYRIDIKAKTVKSVTADSVNKHPQLQVTPRSPGWRLSIGNLSIDLLQTDPPMIARGDPLEFSTAQSPARGNSLVTLRFRDMELPGLFVDGGYGLNFSIGSKHSILELGCDFLYLNTVLIYGQVLDLTGIGLFWAFLESVLGPHKAIGRVRFANVTNRATRQAIEAAIKTFVNEYGDARALLINSEGLFDQLREAREDARRLRPRREKEFFAALDDSLKRTPWYKALNAIGFGDLRLDRRALFKHDWVEIIATRQDLNAAA